LAASSEVSTARALAVLDGLTTLVARASTLILEIAAKGVTHRLKDDRSPVTAADEAAETLILEGLAQLLPGVPVLAEEMAASGKYPVLDTSFIVVDPLDGTKEFIAGSDEFTVNIGIVTGGVPMAGVVAAPKRGLLWRGVVGAKAERLKLLPDGAHQAEPIRTRPWPAQGAVATMSRSHLDQRTQALLERLGPLDHRPSGSSVKFCLIAEGQADVYPRLAPVCEWDVAAAHAVLSAAGGVVIAPDGGPVAYGQAARKFLVPSFIAWGDPAKAATVKV
jgi:3'(2'), 5'-bisphosphate nucleotidase